MWATAAPIAQAESVRIDKSYQPLSEPTRLAPEIARSFYGIDTELLTQKETTSLDRWYVPLSEPVRPIRRAVNTKHDFFVDVSVPTVDVVDGPIQLIASINRSESLVASIDQSRGLIAFIDQEINQDIEG